MSFKTRCRITVAYDGTDFFGWQKQTRPGQVSIQETLEQCLTQIFQEPVRVVGSGRTDRGVHARAQIAHFDCPKDPRPLDLHHKLQQMTPDTIAILRLQTAPTRFHAQLWSRKKQYEYNILARKAGCPFRLRYSYHHPWPLNLAYLNELASALVGEHDFKCFQSTGTDVPDTVRTILNAEFVLDETSEMIIFKIEGNGFLKQMVRNIVGTLLDLHKDRAPVSKIKEILDSKDRRKAGKAAPPQGLFLNKVFYEDSVELQCKDLPTVQYRTAVEF